MTPKERLLTAIKGGQTDRLAWSPFLAYIWETFPKQIQDRGQLAFLEGIGADPLFRGSHYIYKVLRDRCEIKEFTKGGRKETVYETPVGRLKAEHTYSEAGNTWFITEHPIKTEEDFKILTFIYENMQILPDIGKFNDDYKELGERGLYVPIVGVESKTSFQSMVEYWVGTEELTYALADYPETVEECLEAMKRKSVLTSEIAVNSHAEAFIFWEDSSTTNISPAFFEKYIAPEINSWGRIIHDAGKYLIHHACGHLRALIPLMGKTEIDIIESISPPPTGNIELWEAAELLPDHIGLIGGIEPTVFLNSSIDELRNYVEKLIHKMKGQRYILANSDSCPPGVSIDKFRLVTEMVNRII